MSKRAHNFKDLTGKRFGRYLVIKFHSFYHPPSVPKKRASKWLCRCDCGNRRVVMAANLNKGTHSNSCGCISAERIVKQSTTHGFGGRKTRHPLHRIWGAIIQRCTNPNSEAYHCYGGRGIKVCKRWRKFENFFSDMSSGWRSGLSVDRINNNGNYTPSNCRWATPSEQCNNTRRNRFVEFQGRRLTVTQWSKIIGINVSSMLLRLEAWPLEKALTTPKLW